MLMSSVIAHRGARGHAPENTLRAIELAAEQGARWVELDVMLSADGVPVIFHDTRLDTLSNGRGRVCDQSAAVLEQVRIHPPKGSQESRQPLPTLAQALQRLHQLGLGLNLEIKPCLHHQARATLIHSLAVLREGPPLPLVISSFRRAAIEEAQRLAPAIPRALLWKRLPKNWRSEARQLEVRAIHLADFALQRWQVAEIKQLGFEVYIYTVNSLKAAEKFRRWGVSGVFSDYPERFLHLPDWSSRQVRAYGEVF